MFLLFPNLENNELVTRDRRSAILKDKDFSFLFLFYLFYFILFFIFYISAPLYVFHFILNNVDQVETYPQVRLLGCHGSRICLHNNSFVCLSKLCKSSIFLNLSLFNLYYVPHFVYHLPMLNPLKKKKKKILLGHMWKLLETYLM